MTYPLTSTNDISNQIRAVSIRCALSDDMRAYARKLVVLADRIDRELMALPLDRDGKVVHYGDVLSQFGEPLEVYALSDPSEVEPMAQLRDSSFTREEWVRLRKMRHWHGTEAGSAHPTCTVEDRGTYMPQHEFRRVRCQACGGMWWEQPNTSLRFAYCPHCGAMALRVGEGDGAHDQ